MVEVIYPFTILFAVCEMCHRNIQAFDECCDMAYQFEWYLFPNQIQRMMPLILNLMQQSNEMKCFGSTAVNQDTFKYVSASKMNEIITVMIKNLCINLFFR